MAKNARTWKMSSKTANSQAITENPVIFSNLIAVRICWSKNICFSTRITGASWDCRSPRLINRESMSRLTRAPSRLAPRVESMSLTANELPPIMFYEPVMPKRLLPHVSSSAKLFWNFCISRYFRFSRFSTNLHSKSNGKSMKIVKSVFQQFLSFCLISQF